MTGMRKYTGSCETCKEKKEKRKKMTSFPSLTFTQCEHGSCIYQSAHTVIPCFLAPAFVYCLGTHEKQLLRECGSYRLVMHNNSCGGSIHRRVFVINSCMSFGHVELVSKLQELLLYYFQTSISITLTYTSINHDKVAARRRFLDELPTYTVLV